jgi:monofunctional biosynthetic peptidoglycan transglycosylase
MPSGFHSSDLAAFVRRARRGAMTRVRVRSLAVEKRHMASSKGSFLSWVRRALMWTLLAVVGLTVLVVLCFRWVPPPTSAVMLAKRFAEPTRGKSPPAVRYRWTRWNAIAAPMGLAVVAAEDQRFPKHWGFDLASIADAVEEHGEKGRLRGASTVTQQVARNLFLWQGRSYTRKTLEAYFTVLLELLWPKRRILEVYLNIAEFGEGNFGVGAATQAYFGKHPMELRPSEAALLAAVLPNPNRFHARNPSAYVRGRATWVEAQMAQLGGLAYLKDL